MKCDNCGTATTNDNAPDFEVIEGEGPRNRYVTELDNIVVITSDLQRRSLPYDCWETIVLFKWSRAPHLDMDHCEYDGDPLAMHVQMAAKWRQKQLERAKSPEVWHWQAPDSSEWEGPYQTREEAYAAADSRWTEFRLRGGPQARADELLDADAVSELLDAMDPGVEGDLNICSHELRDELHKLINEKFTIRVPARETCRFEEIKTVEEDAAQ